ncbi:MAG: DUF1549 domain-containing protein [Rubripirellula sp.]
MFSTDDMGGTMRTVAVILMILTTGFFADSRAAESEFADSQAQDSRGDGLAAWLDHRGREVWGEPPKPCDDLTFARRIYLDLLGRVPSVSELRDYQDLGELRRKSLVEQLVFGEGLRKETYERLSASNLARHWRRVLLPPGTTVNGSPESIERWLSDAFKQRTPYDEMMRQLARIPSTESSGQYYQLVGSLPENYAGHISRVMLGVRIECAQCHDHPFTDWKQEDFWGLAAFYSDLGRPGDAADASKAAATGSIEYEGTVYQAKMLWSDESVTGGKLAPRAQFAQWVTAKDNLHFSATAANRFWQFLVGHGLYADVENLDEALPSERAFLDELGRRFANDGFDVNRLIAAICKTSWYQAGSVDEEPTDQSFARTLKVISPEQVFDSLEQSLLLPVSRIDPSSSRWTGDRMQLVSRLSETVGATPEDYAAGIPQALLLMNGKMTNDAISLDRSRLLRAVVESPFFNDNDRIKTLYLAVLTREPSAEESEAMVAYLDSKSEDTARNRAYGEILWALLNSPEFVLCR